MLPPAELCSQMSYAFRRVGAAGIEPASAVCKTAALPLDEAPLFLRSLPECCPQADLQQIHDPIHLVRGAREACLRGARAIPYGFEPLFQFGRLTLNQ